MLTARSRSRTTLSTLDPSPSASMIRRSLFTMPAVSTCAGTSDAPSAVTSYVSTPLGAPLPSELPPFSNTMNAPVEVLRARIVPALSVPAPPNVITFRSDDSHSTTTLPRSLLKISMLSDTGHLLLASLVGVESSLDRLVGLRAGLRARARPVLRPLAAAGRVDHLLRLRAALGVVGSVLPGGEVVRQDLLVAQARARLDSRECHVQRAVGLAHLDVRLHAFALLGHADLHHRLIEFGVLLLESLDVHRTPFWLSTAVSGGC